MRIEELILEKYMVQLLQVYKEQNILKYNFFGFPVISGINFYFNFFIEKYCLFQQINLIFLIQIHCYF